MHCYRFFGSLDEAEDALQETWLRAWRRISSLKDQSALRAWLYKIATNVSLDMLDRHQARSLPILAYPPADPQSPLPSPILDPIWIDPLPDEYLDWHSLNPEARIELHESVNLAFLTVLQLLPGRQRAVLILRDVLGWKAAEVAELLNISVPTVNSALQRARSTLKKHPQKAVSGRRPSTSDKQTETLLDRYIQAWETADATGLVSLLREDAVWTMPPLPAWYRGRQAIRLSGNMPVSLPLTIFHPLPERMSVLLASSVEWYAHEMKPAARTIRSLQSSSTKPGPQATCLTKPTSG